MTNHLLKSPKEAAVAIARVLERGGGKAFLEVREDRCFKSDTWLRVGELTLYPSISDPQDGDSPWVQAVQVGSYGWRVPNYDALLQQCIECYSKPARSGREEAQKEKTRRALDCIAHCATRCGLIYPVFDAGSVAEMPFIRPTTLVVDTSAISQGALDFVVKYLYPMARIKVPAIAHMEILNMADRYMTYRRCADEKMNSANCLYEHVTSQASQRVLLRLELQTETEIERPRLGADPLRGVVHNESDAEDGALGLSKVQRSFADRLILETAIHHRDRLSPDHPTIVLTADQGLSRMTLAEGLHSLFFKSPRAPDVCGRTFSGTIFKPFVDDSSDAPFSFVPLPSLVWELACTFGSARAITASNSESVSVSAIGEGLSWHPFHSRDDLLWVALTSGDTDSVTDGGDISDPAPDDSERPKTEKGTTNKPSISAAALPTTLTGAYRFTLAPMLKLILAFQQRETVKDHDGMSLVGLTTLKRYADYRNFLLAGGFAERGDGSLKKLPVLDELIDAFKTNDPQKLGVLFQRVHSFKGFIGELEKSRPLSIAKVSTIARSAIPTYISLAEVSCLALDIADEGIFRTPESPAPAHFAKIAMKAYLALKNGERYVLTGRWLEELARSHGIHPIRARERLNEAREGGHIERFTEGSTPETQFERHNMMMLEVEKSTPVIRLLNLYHGGFLIPGKASVSIRLEDKAR